MRYKTSDLSKMLDVSANTIRRFAEKGYLSPDRDDKNQYRYFGNEDIEKITYISKYRKIGFSHEEIADMLNANMKDNIAIYQQKMEEMAQEIQRLQSIHHMLKDDIGMMRAVSEYGDGFFEMVNTSVYYVSYKKDEELRTEEFRRKTLHRFLYDFPEIEYVYIIRKDDILNRRLQCEEAIAVRSKWVDKRGICMDDAAVEHYPGVLSVLKIVKLPIDFNSEARVQEEIKRLLYDEYLAYMRKHGYRLAGDAIGVKIGFSKEDDREMQYVVWGVPVEKVEENV